MRQRNSRDPVLDVDRVCGGELAEGRRTSHLPLRHRENKRAGPAGQRLHKGITVFFWHE